MLSVNFNFAANHIMRNMGTAQRAHAKAMEQLSSGYKINVAADAPADLIMSEKLRSQIEGLERAMQNTSESNNILGIMDGALGQVQGIITKMTSLAIEAANTGVVSADRIAANQAEMDAGLQAIDRILGTTSYGGRKLLTNMRASGLIGDDHSGAVNAGKLLQDKDGKNILDNLPPRDGDSGKLVMIDRDQNHAPQISDDGKTIKGEKTFVLPPAEEGGEATRLTFADGTSLDEILSTIREKSAASLPPEGAPADIPPPETPSAGDLFTQEEGVFANRRGADINTIKLDSTHLAKLAALPDEDAKSSLANYMNDFTRELEIDLAGWNKLSDADKSMLLTADRMANLGMSDLGGIKLQTGTDKDGNAVYDRLNLTDLFAGGKASLSRSPAAAMEILQRARKDVTAERAQIGVTQRMAEHENNVMEAMHEATTRYESFIRDTEFTEAVTEMSRTDIIQQTGMSLLKKVTQQQRDNILNLFA
jgi:flagellin